MMMDQDQQNKLAWNTGAYEAWVNRLGTPAEAAQKLKTEPEKRMGSLYPYFGSTIAGKRVINLLGSHGSKAVALALLGAEATVVDFSSENERYARELAREAGINIRYIVSDVLKLPEETFAQPYDVVFMENGILHYFHDLELLFKVVARLLRRGGVLLLQDFHPVSTKLITSKGTTANIRKHKVTGDYFDTSLQETEVSFSKYLNQQAHTNSSSRVLLRKWTMGEIITAIASQGLHIKVLEELPNLSSEAFDKGIPKTFIVAAEKI